MPVKTVCCFAALARNRPFGRGAGQRLAATRKKPSLNSNAWSLLYRRLPGWLKAKVVRRWHDNSHTLVTEFSESGAGDEVIMSIAGHVSRAMLSRYSHVRMEAKRRALDEIAARQCAADAKRKEDAERREPVAVSSPSASVIQ